jgi:hypothetical protein
MPSTKTCAPITPNRNAGGGEWRIYVIAAAASLALSAWGAWAAFIPNPDGFLYLRSAEMIAAGRWTDALGIYGWPMYCIVIAAAMALTGLKAFLAAQLVNALFGLIATVAFIALVSRLANGDRLIVLCAAAVILLQPHLTELRPSIVRDNGYFAFLILTLYLVARDGAVPSRATKLAIGAAIVAAGLFRIEGFFLAALVPIYYIVRRPGNWRWPAAIFAMVAACLMLLPGVLLWTNGILGGLLTGRVEIGGVASYWANVSTTIAAHVQYLRHGLPYGGASWGAYVGMTLGIVTVIIVRALTIPLAILTVFAFFPQRLMPQTVNNFVLWFAFGQLPLLLVFTFVLLYLDKRYAMGMVVVLDIPLVFVLAHAIRQWRPGSAERFFLPAAAAVLVAVWAFSLPRPSKLGYLKEAGEWIGRELPSYAPILTNDAWIAYFSGRADGQGLRLWVEGAGPAPSDAELAAFDYLAFQAENANDLPTAVANLPGRHLVRSFTGQDGHHVFVFARDRAAAAAGGDDRRQR